MPDRNPSYSSSIPAACWNEASLKSCCQGIRDFSGCPVDLGLPLYMLLDRRDVMAVTPGVQEGLRDLGVVPGYTIFDDISIFPRER